MLRYISNSNVLYIISMGNELSLCCWKMEIVCRIKKITWFCFYQIMTLRNKNLWQFPYQILAHDPELCFYSYVENKRNIFNCHFSHLPNSGSTSGSTDSTPSARPKPKGHTKSNSMSQPASRVSDLPPLTNDPEHRPV